MPKFDLAQTQAVSELFAEPREGRDKAWREQFYAAVPDATLMAFDPQVNQGPVEFPYFHLAIPDSGPVTPFCVTHLLEVVLDNGFGIAIFVDSSRSEVRSGSSLMETCCPTVCLDISTAIRRGSYPRAEAKITRCWSRRQVRLIFPRGPARQWGISFARCITIRILGSL